MLRHFSMYILLVLLVIEILLRHCWDIAETNVVLLEFCAPFWQKFIVKMQRTKNSIYFSITLQNFNQMVASDGISVKKSGHNDSSLSSQRFSVNLGKFQESVSSPDLSRRIMTQNTHRTTWNYIKAVIVLVSFICLIPFYGHKTWQDFWQTK